MTASQEGLHPSGPGQPVDHALHSSQIQRIESGIFSYIPHPHIALRHQQGPVKVADQMDRSTPLARLNSRLALIITVAVGSMWAAYIFAVLSLVSLPSALNSGNTIIIVGWIAQTFLQLVLLPVIIVGQNIQGAAADKRSEQTYKDAEAVLHEALQIQQHLCAQDEQLKAQEKQLADIILALQSAYPALGGPSPAPSQ